MRRVLLWGALVLLAVPSSAWGHERLSVLEAKAEIKRAYETMDYIPRCWRISLHHVYCRAVDLAGAVGQDPDRYCFTFDVWPRKVGLHACFLRDCPYNSARLNPKHPPPYCDA